MRSLICCMALIAGCKLASQPAPTYPVRVMATSDEGEPLAGVQVAADGKALGSTDKNGEILASLDGTEGQKIQLSFTCPEHYESGGTALSLMLRSFASVDQSGPQHTTVQVQCAPSEDRKVIAVRAGQPNLPVMLHGEVVAHTGSGGTAHVLLKERAGSSVRLTIDTSSAPGLRPESPTRMFAVSAKDDFAVWDQPFELIKKTKHKVKTEAVTVAAPPVPYRLD